MTVPLTKIFCNEDNLNLSFLFGREVAGNYSQSYFEYPTLFWFILFTFFLDYLNNSHSDLVILMNVCVMRENYRTCEMNSLVIYIL